MTHREIKKEDFVGKTVTDLDCEAVNIIRFKFSDGTALAIEVDALGHGLYGMLACDEYAGDMVVITDQDETCTIVSMERLDKAIDTWRRTKIGEMAAFAQEGQDLYLRMVSEAAGLSYGETLRRFNAEDPGIQSARTYVKSTVMYRLHMDPVSLLTVHDATLVKVSS